MRIDVSAYLGRWPFRSFRTTTCAALLDRMDLLGIDLAIVANLHGLFYQNPQPANAELAAWIAAEPRARGRLVPFAVLNPTYPGWRDDLAVCRGELGCRGVRLFPQYHDYTPGDPALAEFLGVAAAEDFPVGFALRLIDARGRSWLDSGVVVAETEQLRLDALARALAPFPALRWLVSQAIFEQLDAAAVAQLTGARVLFDTTRATTCGVAGPNSYDLVAEQTRFGAEKFAFGSMTPFSDPCSPVLRLTAGGLSPAALAAAFGGNARRFLRL
jgi:predicted TIM-barrel fold metal-dependent hydrolase